MKSWLKIYMQKFVLNILYTKKVIQPAKGGCFGVPKSNKEPQYIPSNESVGKTTLISPIKLHTIKCINRNIKNFFVSLFKTNLFLHDI